MKRLICALTAILPLGAAAERLTQECNTNYGTGDVWVYTSVEAQPLLLAAASSPTSNPAIFERLWTPRSAVSVDFSAYPPNVVLRFDRVQNTQEITDSIKADPVLANLGVVDAWAGTTQICYSPGPPATPVTITEYFNSGTGHYFMSSSPEENAIIDGGGAGPDWSRTGESMRTIQADYCYGSRPVFRFYGPGPNSHFFSGYGRVRKRAPQRPGMDIRGRSFRCGDAGTGTMRSRDDAGLSPLQQPLDVQRLQPPLRHATGAARPDGWSRLDLRRCRNVPL